MAKSKIVQRRNPVTGHYVRVNVDKVKITGHKKSPGPYKGIPVFRTPKKRKVRKAPMPPTTITRSQVKRAAKIKKT